MASPGSGSSNHLTLENFNSVAGTKIVHIPYKGAGPAVNDVVGGQVDLTLASGAASKPLIDGGKVKALAVTSRKRNPLLPQVPTFAESGFVGFESIAGQGLFAPAGTPRDIVNRINAEVNAIIATPEVQERWTQMGIDRVEQTPEQFAAWLARESDKWALLIRSRRHQARMTQRRRHNRRGAIDMQAWRQLLAGLVAIAAGVIYATHAHAGAPQQKGQAPGYYRMMLGDFEVIALSDGTLGLPGRKDPDQHDADARRPVAEAVVPGRPGRDFGQRVSRQHRR